MSSDLHVFVRFDDRCVFAGEEVRCIITFKNLAEEQVIATPTLGRGRKGSVSQLAARSGASELRPQSRHLSTNHARGPGHQATEWFGTSVAGTHAEALPEVGRAPLSNAPRSKHQRSISIISAGLTNSAGENAGTTPGRPGRRSPMGHARSSTIHGFPTGLSGTLQVPVARGDGNSETSISPTATTSTSGTSTTDLRMLYNARRPTLDATRGTLGQLPKDRRSEPDQARTVSGSSIDGNDRSSNEFYSVSNHSQETLVSEQASLASERPPFPSARMRQHYHMNPVVPKKPSVVKLLMGYAQINGVFVLDGSLVDQSPFEEVKRKGFLGGQAGGGVVGVKKRQSTAAWGGFNLDSIGESLGTLIGGSDLSSVKEMKAVTSSRSIPILSTPQSLLFVDLQLATGDEKSFSFALSLPQGLPSSYRGKAIKITYNLVLGIQGIPGDRDVQSMRQVTVPFRVFSGVDQDGELFGHDLMQPYVILQDSARTAAVDPDQEHARSPANASPLDPDAANQDFLAYVDTLLDKNRRRQSSSGTLEASRTDLAGSEDRPARRAIKRAILLCNQISGDASPNRFEIARAGRHVAIVTLDRPLHRLGETVTAVIDFSNAQLACLNLRATLESTEKVNSALAVRSATSITRVSRRVYASHSETTLFAERVLFSPSIPSTATPTFLTSGVNLDWSLRFEFSTTKVHTHDEDDEDDNMQMPDFLEEIVNDERGVFSAAVETIECESFEAVVPITVYGDVIMDGRKDEGVIVLTI